MIKLGKILSELSDTDTRFIFSKNDNSIECILMSNSTNKRVASCYLQSGNLGPNSMEIWAVTSNENGGGTLLLKNLIEAVKNKTEIKILSLHVYKNNEKAIKLYKKMGFEIYQDSKESTIYGMKLEL